MNGQLLLLASIVLCVTASACRPGGPPGSEAREAELESLRAILESDRQAHLETDARRLVFNLADTLIDVADGEILREAPSDVEASFASYLDGAEYQAWDGMVPPIIQLSDDLSMAWVARKVRVERDEPDGKGGGQTDGVRGGLDRHLREKNRRLEDDSGSVDVCTNRRPLGRSPVRLGTPSSGHAVLGVKSLPAARPGLDRTGEKTGWDHPAVEGPRAIDQRP